MLTTSCKHRDFPFQSGAVKTIIEDVPNTISPMKTEPAVATMPTKARIIRAVASSTAVETGQSIKELEVFLQENAQLSKYSQLNLASG